MKREIFSPETNDEVPKCEQCRGVVRPNVVLFGNTPGWAREVWATFYLQANPFQTGSGLI